MKQYFNIPLPTNFDEVIDKLQLKTYTVLDNGSNDYLIGYCNNKDKILTISNIKGYAHLKGNGHYLFGYIPYDQKNIFLPKSYSNNTSLHHLPNSEFFTADGVFISKNKSTLFFGTSLEYSRVLKILSKNTQEKEKSVCSSTIDTVKLQHKTTKQEYIENVKHIKNHIQKGNIYEMNYCISYESENSTINPVKAFNKLRSKTVAPFSASLQINNTVILSASPERFLNKSGNTIVSQPIKGTVRRGNSEKEDLELKNILSKDQKELSENIMIVDLVRNDMSKIASKSSVSVSELCEIYTFRTVHQLISTVQAIISDEISIQDILKALFPMGSMTGAPKLKATELIDKYENFKREIYSGSIGFISPNNSFDFNVVIRSIVYNRMRKTISISVGSAITIKSDPLAEYEECVLKLSAIESALY